MAEYQPGVCNIGRAERAKRRYIGYFGFLTAALVLLAVPVAQLPAIWLLASAAPFYGGFLGYLQARSGFCAGFGLAGVYDVSDAADERTDVADADARKADRRKALVLQLESAGLAVIAAGLVYGIGVALA